MTVEFPILTILILLPVFSSIYIMLFINQNQYTNKAAYTKYIGILSSTLTLCGSCYIVSIFDFNKTGYHFVEHYSLIPSIGLDYHVGLDGVSILFVLLTAILIPICFIASIFTVTKRVKEYMICFLLLESVVIGFFCSINLLLFYIFFEAMLIPMYLIIGCFGGENRIYAAIKFFLYTFVGSILFLFSLIIIYIKIGSFDIIYLTAHVRELGEILPSWIWIAIFIAMAVKVPMVPFHTWLPDAHVQAPTTGSVILAGILLKVGGYGMIRILVQLMPEFSDAYASYVINLSVVAIIYASFVAMAQEDMKKMIAYSSVAHMGYVTAGIFTLNSVGLEGAMFQMISHGIVSAGLFLIVGMLYDRMHTKDISAYGGVAKRMPVFATCFMILVMGSVGLPGTSGFVGEFLSLTGMFKYNMYIAAISAFSVVLGAVYMLSLYKRVMLGEIKNPLVSEVKDVGLHEIIVLIPIVVILIYIGVQPESILSIFRLEISNLAVN